MPLPAEQKGVEKLQQHVVNMDNLQTEAAAAFQGVDAVFCALGTTRSVGLLHMHLRSDTTAMTAILQQQQQEQLACSQCFVLYHGLTCEVAVV